jgi:hypothetical protein
VRLLLKTKSHEAIVGAAIMMKKQWMSIIICLLAITCFTGSVFAQAPVKEPSATKAVSSRTVKGKIVYSATVKRYVLRGQGEVYGIANKNPEVLDQYAKGKQIVTVVGHSA